MKNIYYFLVGFVCAVYLVIVCIDKTIEKVFKKLPRLLKVAIIYSLIGGCLFGAFVSTLPTKVKVINNEKVIVIEKEIAVASVEEETPTQEQKQKDLVFKNENETKIYNECLKQGLNQKQALLVLSISKLETGNWKSKAFVNKYNFGGIMNSKGLKTFDSYEQGLEKFVSLLKNYYFNKGLNTVAEIGAKYCPVGAKNDPNGINKGWVSSVSSIYDYYLNKLN